MNGTIRPGITGGVGRRPCAIHRRTELAPGRGLCGRKVISNLLLTDSAARVTCRACLKAQDGLPISGPTARRAS